MDAKGGETEGVLDAENQSEAISLIRAKSLFPTKVMELGAAGAKKAMAQTASKRADANAGRAGTQTLISRLLRAKVKPKHLMVLTRQLATLVQAGLPLLKGLRILLKQEKNTSLREALGGMGEAVEGGSTFSEALSQYPHIFDKLFVNMVKAGEAGGVLDVVLARLAEFMEKAERVKNKVKSAMVYPIVVLFFAIGITGFLMVSVIPKFKAIFDDLLEGKQLPALTQFVINVSTAFQKGWYYMLAVVVIIIVLSKVVKRTEAGRFYVDKFNLKLPLFGQLFVKTAVARFARTLSTLLTSGVPILQALNIVRDTSGSEVIAKAIQQVHDSVKEGDNMSMPLEASGVFPGMVVSMVDVGEETGALPEMLARIADTYEDEVDRTVDALTSIIEPIMIIFLALIVGTIVIAMFVPMIKIIGELGGG
jgi:type IV pilus assembly protein PilC